MTIPIPIPIPNSNPTARFSLPPMSSPVSRKVAIIGAGAAGLCAALELRREGHQVVVYERDTQLGGTWAYTPETEADPMGLDPTRKVVHTSLYASLRTNLSREVMGFRAYPFVPSREPGRDGRRFPSHREVLEYLKDYAREFGLGELIRFGSDVWHVGLLDRKWIVRSRKSSGSDDEMYDAVVVCNGHYTEPRVAEIPGIDVWPGKQIHSHNYRIPDPFRDQIVVVIGNAASATDISRDIAGVAREVHITSRSVESGFHRKLPGHKNIWIHSMIKSVHKDGTVVFQNKNEVCAHTILHCSGYKYYFPFLETNGIVSVEDNRVGPLYKQVFPPALAPWISFVGLPLKVAPFPLFEYQSKWIAGVLSGRILLPSTEEMTADIDAFYSSLEASGIHKRYTHRLEDEQFDYNNWLAGQCGSPPVEEWRKQIYFGTRERRIASPEMYRDEWEDEDLLMLAHQDFKQCGMKVSPSE